jgi:hypothetical protein
MSVGLEAWKAAINGGVFKHGLCQAVSSEGRQHYNKMINPGK